MEKKSETVTAKKRQKRRDRVIFVAMVKKMKENSESVKIMMMIIMMMLMMMKIMPKRMRRANVKKNVRLRVKRQCSVEGGPNFVPLSKYRAIIKEKGRRIVRKTVKKVSQIRSLIYINKKIGKMSTEPTGFISGPIFFVHGSKNP